MSVCSDPRLWESVSDLKWENRWSDLRTAAWTQKATWSFYFTSVVFCTERTECSGPVRLLTLSVQIQRFTFLSDCRSLSLWREVITWSTSLLEIKVSHSRGWNKKSFHHRWITNTWLIRCSTGFYRSVAKSQYWSRVWCTCENIFVKTIIYLFKWKDR